MICIIMIVAILLGTIYVGIKYKEERGQNIYCGVLLCILIFFVGAFLSSNYEEEAQYLHEIELTQLENTEHETYVSKLFNGKHLYRPRGGEEITIMEGDMNYIEVVESDECEKPVLKVYKRRTKFDWVSIGLKTRNEYIFFVPAGTYRGLYAFE